MEKDEGRRMRAEEDAEMGRRGDTESRGMHTFKDHIRLACSRDTIRPIYFHQSQNPYPSFS